jgi:7-cyano-7-deazaguanine synthase
MDGRQKITGENQQDRAKKAIILVSGGMDSCVTAAIARSYGYQLLFLHLNYGQRTEKRELKAFRDLADYYEVGERNQLVVSIEHLAKIGGSSLTDERMPVTKANLENKDIPTSYVPFRNAHILSIAVSWAETVGAVRIFIGAVYEDSSGYPDCRPEYYDAFNEVIRLGTAKGDIRIETPIIHLSKEEIILKGAELGAPLHLTWSCYQNEDLACGVCDSCALRLRGYQKAGMVDPIPYLTRPNYL